MKAARVRVLLSLSPRSTLFHFIPLAHSSDLSPFHNAGKRNLEVSLHDMLNSVTRLRRVRLQDTRVG